MTTDVDVVQISHPLAPLLLAALQRFGKETASAKDQGLYLESVLDAIPPLAGSFRKRCKRMAGPCKVLTVWQPEANDLAASKLKRYATKDRDDLRHLCDNGFIHAENLTQSLTNAFLWTAEDDPDRERAFRNLENGVAYLEGKSREL
jgi:hypothetical protein